MQIQNKTKKEKVQKEAQIKTFKTNAGFLTLKQASGVIYIHTNFNTINTNLSKCSKQQTSTKTNKLRASRLTAKTNIIQRCTMFRIKSYKIHINYFRAFLHTQHTSKMLLSTLIHSLTLLANQPFKQSTNHAMYKFFNILVSDGKDA